MGRFGNRHRAQPVRLDYRPRRNFYGIADSTGQNLGGARREAVEDVRPDGGGDENDG